MCAARRQRRTQLQLERLEDRTAPAGIPFQFTIDDPGGDFNAFPTLQMNLEAAGQILTGVLGGLGSMEVAVHPNNNIARASGGTATVTFVRAAAAYSVYENGTISEARTGTDPNGANPDILLEFNTRDYLPLVGFDPSGAARTGIVPNDKLDFISIALHEIIHALGFQGYREVNGANYGGFSGTTRTTYDDLTAFGSGAQAGLLRFLGPNATATYGGPVPLTSVGPSHFLTSQNFFHVGNPPGMPGTELSDNLMNGVSFNWATRYFPGALDLHILSDLGWAVTLPPEPPPSEINFESPVFQVAEQRHMATIAVTRTGDASRSVALDFTTANGTARAAKDFKHARGTLVFASGETRQVFTVSIINDALVEPNETVRLILGAVSGNARLGPQAAAFLRILDNDAQRSVGVQSGASSGSEATAAVELLVSLAALSGRKVTVQFNVTGGAANLRGVDHVLARGTLTFRPGEQNKHITISVIGAAAPEPSETIVVTLSQPRNARLRTARHTYTIVDDD